MVESSNTTSSSTRFEEHRTHEIAGYSLLCNSLGYLDFFRPHPPRRLPQQPSRLTLLRHLSSNTKHRQSRHGLLLNGDLAIVVNFTNPSKKSDVDFSYVMFELFFYNTLIATERIEPFIVPKGMSMFTSFHLLSSQERFMHARTSGRL
ncbi:hypothetical protein Bca52824_096480 [Brassica carinata]|uniref:Uncharacterized protein n=1 Tax=Brassica carinata TaxID=52824 RepID=A0A8X7TIJ1_BRACI|nr:hypothetical protein Bca52824_096480 [Brassica carinata]